MKKAGQKGNSVHSIENRQCYETEKEKQKFIHESFKLDTNAILNADAKLKEAVIKLFLDRFEVLATHPSQYGKTEVLERKNNLLPGRIPYNTQMRLLNPDQKENLRNQIDKWLEHGVIEPSVSPWVSPLVPGKKED